MIYDENLNEARAHLSELLLTNLDAMEFYTKQKYLVAMKAFCVRHRSVVASFEQYCEEHEADAAEAAGVCAEQFMADAQAALTERQQGKKKFAANMELQTFRQVMAAFVVPGIGAMQMAHGQLLIDALRGAWNRAYPEAQFAQADVNTLNEGFKLQTGCYITTAVCGSFGKGDNCYELMTFRAFRDGYLRKRPDGEAMIWEYYKTAPAVVAAINARDDAKEVYRHIWDRYLAHCLMLIETEQYEACTEVYRGMVEELRKAYV